MNNLVGSSFCNFLKCDSSLNLTDYSAFLKFPSKDCITFKWTTLVISGPPSTRESSILQLLLNECPDTVDPDLERENIGKIVTNLMQVEEPKKCMWKRMNNDSLRALGEEERNNSRSPHPHLVHLIDSRGHAAFLKIAPGLLHYNPVNIFTLKLNEKLDDESVKFYYTYKINKEHFSEPKERQLTHLQHLEASFRSLLCISPPDMRITISPELPHFILVQEILQDSSDENNDLLRSNNLILQSRLIYRFESVTKKHKETRDKDIIFPITRSDNTMAINIRRKICKSFVEATFPYKWFRFLLQLYQLQSKNLINKSECLDIGRTLDMDPVDIEAALIYFHNLTIFLYFPKVLPDIVFLHSQLIFDKLAELISITIPNAYEHLDEEVCIRNPIPDGSHKQLLTAGTFESRILECFPDFPPRFTAESFLKVMEHLHVLEKLPLPKALYFLPLALPTTPHPNAFTKRFEVYVDPLVLTWNIEPLHQGILHELVIHLLKHDKSPKFCLPKLNAEECQYRNVIRLRCLDQGGSILLVDSIYWLEIYYFGKLDNCPGLRSAILEEICKLEKKYHIKQKVEECFICRLEHKEVKATNKHLCYVNVCNTVTCENEMTVGDLDPFLQLPWFKKTDQNIQG